MYDVSEVINDPGFYSCKKFPKVIVSKTGIVKNADTEEIIQVSNSENEYPRFTYPGEESVHLHRILAFMFVEKPIDFENVLYVVNHIDGKKTNFNLTNLEWVTMKRNAEHAYETGLRNDNTPIQVKDLRTNEVRRYYSLQECARHFKVNGFNIHWNLLPRNYGKVSFNYFVLINEGDVWPVIDEDQLGKHRNGRPKPIVVTAVETNTAVIYDSAGSAARAHGLKSSTLRQHMHRSPTKPIDGNLFKYLDDLDLAKDIEMLSIGRKTVPPKKPAVPVRVTNKDTGETKEYASTEEFAQFVGALKNTIQKRIYETGGRWRNYYITYLWPPKE